jgi:hypothetical protein
MADFWRLSLTISLHSWADKVSLDIFWLRDESLEEFDNLPALDVLAQEIVKGPKWPANLHGCTGPKGGKTDAVLVQNRNVICRSRYERDDT